MILKIKIKKINHQHVNVSITFIHNHNINSELNFEFDESETYVDSDFLMSEVASTQIRSESNLNERKEVFPDFLDVNDPVEIAKYRDW